VIEDVFDKKREGYVGDGESIMDLFKEYIE
jgi:hypothetical protein